MRLNEDQIKQGILHPERPVRHLATAYFADSFSNDPTVMPLVIQAITTYGWKRAFESLPRLEQLAQTEEAFLWLVAELRKVPKPATEDEEQHCSRLSRFIANADVGLLRQHHGAIQELSSLSEDLRPLIDERVDLLNVDSAAGWRQIEEACQSSESVPSLDKFNFGHLERLVEAVARDPSSAQRVLSILPQPVTQDDPLPKVMMAQVAIRMAGEMRLQTAAPFICAKIVEDLGDWVNEDSARALSQIGGDAAVEAISKDFATQSWHYRLYASGALENVRGDLVVSRSLQLYGKEDDADIQQNLLRVLLANFATEAIEPTRQWTRRTGYDVREELVAIATLMQIPFPELEGWKKEERARAADRERQWKRMSTWFTRPPAAAPLPRALAELDVPLPIRAKQKVGRNDPCPCGSGKKYKKCCGKD